MLHLTQSSTRHYVALDNAGIITGTGYGCWKLVRDVFMFHVSLFAVAKSVLPGTLIGLVTRNLVCGSYFVPTTHTNDV